MVTYVLVHGGWHGGWCWKKMVPLLRSAGHDVFTPTLTGLGERSHLLSPDIGLDTHIQDVVMMLEYEDLDDVVLVGHSYGGMVITGVSEHAAQRLSHLVYLDAFIPQDGQSFKDVAPATYERLNKRVQAEGEGWKVPVPDGDFGVTDEADLSWMRTRLSAQPFKTAHQKVRLQNPEALALPRTYIYCRRPTGEAGAAQYAEQAKTAGWQFHELYTGHDAMITVPHELADLLLKIE